MDEDVYRYQVQAVVQSGFSNETFAVFYVYDNGKKDPEFSNPPEMPLVNALRRAFDILEAQADVAAGVASEVVRPEPGIPPEETRRYDVSVVRQSQTGGNEMAASFSVYDDEVTDPAWVTVPDPIFIAAARRGLDIFEAQADVMAGRTPKATVYVRGITPPENVPEGADV